MALFPSDDKCCCGDLLSLPGEERYELLDGIPCLLDSPSDAHQACLCELVRQFGNSLVGKEGVGRPAPYAVLPFASRDDDPEQQRTVLQPDFSLICDRSKLTRPGCMRAPDLVIEILSPSTKSRDLYEKLHIYEASGVREYWILDAEKHLFTVYLSEDRMFRYRRLHSGDARVPVTVLDGLEIDLGLVFRSFAVM